MMRNSIPVFVDDEHVGNTYPSTLNAWHCLPGHNPDRRRFPTYTTGHAAQQALVAYVAEMKQAGLWPIPPAPKVY